MSLLVIAPVASRKGVAPRVGLLVIPAQNYGEHAEECCATIDELFSALLVSFVPTSLSPLPHWKHPQETLRLNSVRRKPRHSVRSDRLTWQVRRRNLAEIPLIWAQDKPTHFTPKAKAGCRLALTRFLAMCPAVCNASALPTWPSSPQISCLVPWHLCGGPYLGTTLQGSWYSLRSESLKL